MTALRCRLRLHQWTKWSLVDAYIDTSWGGRIASSGYVRRCERCGLAEVNNVYGDPTAHREKK